eukprot:CAMPEP_0172605934 /NCGR_PEP_ID=MMETSP1068-20121228/26130_1 /TAXON_ID=35684 /ORGANISM="Pseudopedinella elastica, Strain CCMP716" /LENGTH=254 /DNA_ID=CAMNT_0013408479 /DNA_START=144 /DNA_END=905 /DNA_ORIENTATION=+
MSVNFQGNGDDSEEEARRLEEARAQVAEIASSEPGGVAPLLRVALERGYAHLLPDLLKEYARKEEGAIEKLCQEHYHGYLDSVQQLVKMRTDSHGLRGSVVALNSQLQTAGGRVVAALQAKEEIETRRKKLLATQAQLQHSRAALALAMRAESQMNRKRFVSATDSLERLKDFLTRDQRANAPASSRPSASSPSRGHADTIGSSGGDDGSARGTAAHTVAPELPAVMKSALERWLPKADRMVELEARKGLNEWL